MKAILTILLAFSGIVTISVPANAQKQTIKVFYDNDEATDVFTDEYLYALHQTGDIQLMGVSTSTSVGPFNKYVKEKGYMRMYNDRLVGKDAAGKSGFVDLPETWKGPMGHIEKPSNGRIIDSRPLFSEAAKELEDLQTKQLLCKNGLNECA